jgi:hypothetical protein
MGYPIVIAFFKKLASSDTTFGGLKELLGLFLNYLDLAHPQLVSQANCFDFIHTLKQHAQRPTLYRPATYRKGGLYDTRELAWFHFSDTISDETDE